MAAATKIVDPASERENCLRFASPAEAAIAKVLAIIFQKTMILRFFRIFRHVGELEICLVSKFQLCTTLGGRKNAEKPRREFSEFFGSVGSVFRSVRSIWRPRVVVDRSADRRRAVSDSLPSFDWLVILLARQSYLRFTKRSSVRTFERSNVRTFEPSNLRTFARSNVRTFERSSA